MFPFRNMDAVEGSTVPLLLMKIRLIGGAGIPLADTKLTDWALIIAANTKMTEKTKTLFFFKTKTFNI